MSFASFSLALVPGAEDRGDLEGDEGVGISSRIRCEEACHERSWATNSDESLAALTAKVRGIMRRDCANSPMASCSREPYQRGVSKRIIEDKYSS